ncbi:MAG: translesion error-prone DNA polymerase V autoproteolytic subunit [Bacteroidales bacterium]|nr:translesion error-prone DNA polymerase V autoproteolytic subunit [Bacteroidales bacterium]
MPPKKKTVSRNNVGFLNPAGKNENEIPLFTCSAQAGFPSPAEDFLEKRLDLNDYLIKNQSATFLVKVSGDSMKNAGILDGDILVIDRSVEPVSGKIVLAVLDGEFTVKKLIKKNNQVCLVPENESFTAIRITEIMDFKVWGVVTFAIHKV